jgi:hypothetical protein
MYRREYGYCAKCGDEKDLDTHYVHDECKSPHKRGGFHFCAVCGKPWAMTYITDILDYVCMDDLSKKAPAAAITGFPRDIGDR